MMAREENFMPEEDVTGKLVSYSWNFLVSPTQAWKRQRRCADGIEPHSLRPGAILSSLTTSQLHSLQAKQPFCYAPVQKKSLEVNAFWSNIKSNSQILFHLG